MSPYKIINAKVFKIIQYSDPFPKVDWSILAISHNGTAIYAEHFERYHGRSNHTVLASIFF